MSGAVGVVSTYYAVNRVGDYAGYVGDYACGPVGYSGGDVVYPSGGGVGAVGYGRRLQLGVKSDWACCN